MKGYYELNMFLIFYFLVKIEISHSSKVLYNLVHNFRNI